MYVCYTSGLHGTYACCNSLSGAPLRNFVLIPHDLVIYTRSRTDLVCAQGVSYFVKDPYCSYLLG